MEDSAIAQYLEEEVGYDPHCPLQLTSRKQNGCLKSPVSEL